MKNALWALVISGWMVAAGPVAAHGTDEHGKTHSKAKASAIEQTAFGRVGDPSKVSRTIAISMSDQMRYDPAEIRVKTGDTVRFVLSNKGLTLHEFVLGTSAEIKEHAELMKKFPNMEHDEPSQAHVKPSAREDLVWQFNKPGEFQFACLMPGHFEAGMVGKVIVATR